MGFWETSIRRSRGDRVTPRVLYITSLVFLLSTGCDDAPTVPRDETPLAFVSDPVQEVYHNQVYTYTVETSGGREEITVQAVELPGWLDFDAASRNLSGVATAEYLGSHAVRLSASDGADTIFQQYQLTVHLREVEGGSWTIRTTYQWLHDGQPREGTHCFVYSDASSATVKQFIAARVDAVFGDIRNRMAIASDSIFIYPPGAGKIDVYANRFNDEFIGGMAYHGGAIILASDSPFYLPSERWCRTIVEHEILHVVETLIEGTSGLISDVWFREGLADYYAGNAALTTVAELEAWLAPRSSLPGGGNPIQIHTWNDFPAQVAEAETQGLWYPMFELTVRYLMHDRGLGKSYPEIRAMWQDAVSTGRSFSEVFPVYMGISLDYYETNCFILIIDFLNRTNTLDPQSKPLSLTAFAE